MSSRFRRVLTGAAVLPVLACGATADASDDVRPQVVGPGLAGRVLIWPNKCVVPPLCEWRARGVVLVISRDGVQVASVKTDDRGAYAISLPPGAYHVDVANRLSPAGTGLHPREVRVRAGRVRRLTFLYDVGIR